MLATECCYGLQDMLSATSAGVHRGSSEVRGSMLLNTVRPGRTCVNGRRSAAGPGAMQTTAAAQPQESTTLSARFKQHVTHSRHCGTQRISCMLQMLLCCRSSILLAVSAGSLDRAGNRGHIHTIPVDTCQSMPQQSCCTCTRKRYLNHAGVALLQDQNVSGQRSAAWTDRVQTCGSAHSRQPIMCIAHTKKRTLPALYAGLTSETMRVLLPGYWTTTV
jgi:hypothetical protein